MKKTFFFLFLFAFLGSFLSAQQSAKVTIVNNTGYTVDQLIIEPSPSEWNDWYMVSFNVTERRPLLTGHSIEITLPFNLNIINTFYIYLYDTDRDRYVKENVRVTANSRITFTIDDLDLDW